MAGFKGHLVPPPQENIDVYATKEPQEAFHQRILFCLDLYTQSVKVYNIYTKSALLYIQSTISLPSP